VSGTLSYDNNGNVTLDDQGHTLVYDAWNRLVEVKNGGTTLMTYRYDGAGRRITDDDGTTATQLFHSSQWQVLEERTGSGNGTARRQYVWSAVYVDAMVVRDRDTDANGSLDERLNVMQDANFNVTAITNTSGTVQERFVYDPYGKFQVFDASWTAASDIRSWNYLHQGLAYDAVIGWYMNRNRIYSSTMMRFGQQEPTGAEYVDGGNNYLAYKAAPLTGVDPEGLKRVIVAFEGLSIVAAGHVAQNWIPEIDKVKSPTDIRRVFAENNIEDAHRFITDNYKKDKNCRDTVLLYGFSFGGHAAIKLTQILAMDGIPVDGAMTVDPRDQGMSLLITIPFLEKKAFTKPANASYWANFYQWGPNYPGSQVLNANEDRELKRWNFGALATWKFIQDPTNPGRSYLDTETYNRSLNDIWNHAHERGYVTRIPLVLDRVRGLVTSIPEVRK
jgi:RHS repeat-associated protein